MKAKERNIEKDLKIDDSNLDGEWTEQGSLFYYYAEAHAEAILEKDKKKAKMDYVYAVMYSELKKDWSKVFDSKPTEPAVKEHIYCQKKFKVAERDFINASHDVNIMLAAKQAFEHKKKALENKVSLKIGGFYSEPRNKAKDVNTLKMRKAQTNSLKKRKNVNHKKGN